MTRRQDMRALCVLLAVLLVAGMATGQDTGVLLPVDENDVLILEVRAERYLASNGLIGYRHRDQVLLPLGELAAVLEYAIIAYPERGLVDGWLMDEDRTFHLDVRNRSVIIAGRQSGVPAGSLYVDADDVYVTSDVLEDWWPIDLEIDLRGLRVTIIPRETVPLIARLNREAKWAQMSGEDREELNYPRNEAEYRLAAWPFLDATVSFDANRSRPTWRGSLLSRGDLARLSVTGFLGYDNNAVNDWRGWLRAGRTDRDSELLGPLGATSFTLGDVVSTPLPLIDGATRGRGFAVTNRPLGSVSQFDDIDIVGDAPPGWEVELYVDGALHDLQIGDAEGHYFFAAVPLHLGLNTIRAVLYGPNGQTRENVHTYNIRSGMWRRGHLNYNYSSLQLGESIVGSPVTASRVLGQGEWDHRLELGYGLGHTTTLGATVAQTYVEDRLRNYVQGRLLQSAGPLFLQAVGVKDFEEGWAASLSGQTRLGGKSLFLGWSEFSDYHSNTNEGYSDLARRLEARLTGAVQRRGRSLLGYRLKWRHEDSIAELDQRRDFWDLYLGTSFGRVSLSHNFRYLDESGRLNRDSLIGQLRLAGYQARVRLSGELEYDAMTGQGARSVGLVASSRFGPRVTTQLTGRRSFLGEGASYYQAQIDWHLRPVRLGLRGGYDTAYGATVGVSATTALVKSPNSGGWVVSNRPLTNHGAALVRAFIDHDNDGAFGSADEALPGVAFGRNSLWQDIRTADDGQAFLPGLPADQFVNVKIDMSSVEDPYLVPAFAGMTTVVHPGGVSNLEFPFRYVGEIEGLVARDESLTRPLRSVGLELLDADGQRVATAVSEFDGFYLFQDVLPGDYFIGVVKSTLRGDHWVVPEPQPVTVPPGGDYVQGPAVILRGVDDLPAAAVVVAEVEPAKEMGGDLGEMTASADSTDLAGSPTVAQANPAAAAVTDESAMIPAGAASGSDEVAAVERDAAVTETSSTSEQATVTIPDVAESATEKIVAQAEPVAVPPSDALPVTAAPETAPVAEPIDTDATPEIAPDVVRTLHLIYEMLFDSALFAGGSR